MLWRERKEALWSLMGLYPDLECMITDVCVPVSRLADLIGASKRELDASPLPAPIVAHAVRSEKVVRHGKRAFFKGRHFFNASLGSPSNSPPDQLQIASNRYLVLCITRQISSRLRAYNVGVACLTIGFATAQQPLG